MNIARKCIICGKVNDSEAEIIQTGQWVCDECVSEIRLLMGRCPVCSSKELHPITSYWGEMWYCCNCGTQTPRKDGGTDG